MAQGSATQLQCRNPEAEQLIIQAPHIAPLFMEDGTGQRGSGVSGCFGPNTHGASLPHAYLDNSIPDTLLLNPEPPSIPDTPLISS